MTLAGGESGVQSVVQLRVSIIFYDVLALFLLLLLHSQDTAVQGGQAVPGWTVSQPWDSQESQVTPQTNTGKLKVSGRNRRDVM